VGDLTDETSGAFDDVTAVNLRGVWTCMKHELLQMRTQGSGAIVNCSSLGGLVGQAGRAAYYATKHGVIGLTKSAAMDYAPRGARRQHLVDDAPLLVVDDVGRAVLPGERHGVGPRAHGDDAPSAPQRRAGHSHRPHRSDADHYDHLAELSQSPYHLPSQTG
jgi:NAD(P)-dependent dehydrogenase (short-subunit alcohol dehydrogenase family)